MSRSARTTGGEKMTETDRGSSPAPASVPDGSPFVTPPVEGLPFKRGSEEDRAIDRVLENYAARSDEA
jgi:hypothetical protein